MKNLLIKCLALVNKLLYYIGKALSLLSSYVSLLKTYLSGDECEKFSDCVLLQNLRSKQPPASDRFIEYPWLIENIDIASGKYLDIGSTISDLLFETIPQGIELHTLNLNPKKLRHPEIKFKVGDVRKTDYADNTFDIISCISTLEHIGVVGRYHSDQDEEGDFKAVKEMTRILKPGGKLLITIPYGSKDVLPINRLYNKTRVAGIFSDIEIVEQIFYKFNPAWNVWFKTTEEKAAETDMIKDRWYALSLIKAVK